MECGRLDDEEYLAQGIAGGQINDQRRIARIDYDQLHLAANGKAYLRRL